MKCLIILALAALAQAQSFFPQDTPEVTAAKAAHFAEHAKAAARVGAPLQDVYRSLVFTPFAAPSAPAPVITPEGFIAETPEVAAARAVHFAEHAKAAARVGAPLQDVYRSLVFTPFAAPSAPAPVITPEGFIAETPEVAAARAVHFAEHAKAAARVGAPLQDVYRSLVFTPFATPLAPAPVITPEGFTAETPEVAAARAEHLAEHARATAPPTSFASRASGPYAEYYRAYYNYYYPSQGRSAYTGPQAVPTVLPSGYLADTPEVAYAKATHLYRLYKESTRL